MHVACFSNQFASSQGHGIARYSRELIGALGGIDGLRITPVAAWSDRERRDIDRLCSRTGLVLSPWGRKLTPLGWTFLGLPPLEGWLNSPVELVHALSLGYPVATRRPYVVTVHDLGPLTHPEYFTNTSPWVMKASLRQAVRKAAAIVCVSRSAADELACYVGGQVERRIRVIHEGVGDEFFAAPDAVSLDILLNEAVPAMAEADPPFILAAGKISPRKNISGLLEAFVRIAGRVPHHLVLVGGDGWDMERVHSLLPTGSLASRVHFAGYVSDEHLRALYRRAAFYVHPSFYEGFGLTVLEAMASGCPVVTSNLYSLPEVAGDAALLVNPANSDEIAGAILALCEDASLADSLRAKGHARALQFRWSDCASKVYGVYREVTGG